MDDVFAMVVLAAALGGAVGCADNIRPEAELDAGGEGDGAAPTGSVQTVRNPDGTYTTRLDAAAAARWSRVDLETGLAAETGWDLAGQRFHLMINGGVSGDGGVEVARVDGVLADVTTAPTTGWLTDAVDGDDPNPVPDYAFEQGDGWYDYHPQTHVLTPKPIVWVIRTTEDHMIKLAIESYYDDAGTSAQFELHWAPLEGGS